MPDEITYEHDELSEALTKAQEEFETLFGAIEESDDSPGLDDETAESLRERRAATAGELSDAADKSEIGEQANRAIREVAETASRSIDNGGQSFTDRSVPAGAGSGGGTSGGFGGTGGAYSPPSGGVSQSPGAYTGMGTAMGAGMDPLGTMSGMGAAANPMAGMGMANALAGMGANAMGAGMGAGDMALGGASPQGQAVMDKILAGENPVTQLPSEGASINRAELREAIYDMLKDEMASSSGSDSDYSGGSYDDVGSGIGMGAGGFADAIELAEQYAASGIEYAWGGGHGGEPGPSQGISDGGGAADAHGDYNKVGLDCSGLARDYIWNLHGIDINGTAADQYNMGVEVHPDDAQPGDVYFPADAGVPPSHVGIYVGNGQFLEAQQSGTKLMISEIRPGTFRRMAELS